MVLPALDEAATIGPVVESVLRLAGGLVDEVLVVDGGSTDGTPGLARAAGADVRAAADLLPEVGPVLGKGDSLWRSLSVATGDLVAFCDTDIRNFDNRFVWALLGPLLHDDRIGFVKAFYDRPVELDGVLHETGGGRVTELTARPLLNLYWPDLAGIVQPLSGEYAGRRSLLEQLPFFTGYGVEIGLLVDIRDRAGADAIAQVDLAERIHRNQPMPSLSRMAYGIVTVAAHRLQAEGRLLLAEPPATRYVQFHRESGQMRIQPAEVRVDERPPLARIAGAAGRQITPTG